MAHEVINWTWVIVALVLGISLVGYGGVSFINKERDRQMETQRLEDLKEEKKTEMEKIELQETTRKFQLSRCLSTAQTDFDTSFKLNSYAAPTKDDPSVRIWNSRAIQENVEGILKSDKEFCLKQYGN